MNKVTNKMVAQRVIEHHLRTWPDTAGLVAKVTGQDIEEAYNDLRDEAGNPTALFSCRARVHRTHVSEARSDKIYEELKKILKPAAQPADE